LLGEASYMKSHLAAWAQTHNHPAFTKLLQNSS
jgi:hypothetical protein